MIADVARLDSAGFLVWQLNDFPPRMGFGVEGSYGLVRPDYSPKPVALTFRDRYAGEPFAP